MNVSLGYIDNSLQSARSMREALGIGENCENLTCGRSIRVQIYKNEPHCSDLCRKVIAGEISAEEAMLKRKQCDDYSKAQRWT